MGYAKDKLSIPGHPIDLYHRPRSSFWWAKFKIKGFDRVELSTGTREIDTAKAWAINELPEIVANLKRYGTAKARTFKQVADEYVRECHTKMETGQMAPERYRRAKRISEGFFLPYFKQKPINAFSERDINNWLAWRMTKGLGKRGTVERTEQKPAKGTLRTEMSFLRAIFKLGVREGYLHHTQSPQIKGDYSTLYTDRRDNFTQEEWLQLEAWLNWNADGRPTNKLWGYYRKLARDYIVFLAYTGLRPGREVSEIRWRDLKLVQYVRVDGEAVTEGVVKLIRSKSRDTDKPAIISPQAGKAIARRWQESQFLAPSDYVFCHPDPSNCGEAGSYYKGPDSVWKEALRETKLYLDKRTGRPRPQYSFRHTWITAAQKAGVSTVAIMKQVGHKDASMITRFYGHTDATDFQDELRIDPYRKKTNQIAAPANPQIANDSPKD